VSWLMDLGDLLLEFLPPFFEVHHYRPSLLLEIVFRPNGI